MVYVFFVAVRVFDPALVEFGGKITKKKEDSQISDKDSCDNCYRKQR